MAFHNLPSVCRIWIHLSPVGQKIQFNIKLGIWSSRRVKSIRMETCKPLTHDVCMHHNLSIWLTMRQAQYVKSSKTHLWEIDPNRKWPCPWGLCSVPSPKTTDHQTEPQTDRQQSAPATTLELIPKRWGRTGNRKMKVRKWKRYGYFFWRALVK